MSKNKTCRFTTDKNGNIEVTMTIPADAVAKADEFAARLPATRAEILAHYFEQLPESFCDGINDHCLLGWQFPTKAAVKSFIQREKLDQQGTGIIRWSNGGFGVDTLFAA